MEIDEILRQLGFKEYEIKAYTTLLFLVSATPREIAKEAKVPQTKIYGVLEELRKKGVVSISPGKPVRYNLVPLQTGLLSLVKSNKKKWEEVEKKIEELSKDIEKKRYSTKILLYEGWDVIRKIIIEDIKNSKKEVLRILRFGKIDEEIFSEMEEAIKRGVKIKIIGPYKKEREHIIEKYKRIGCKIALTRFEDLPLVRENIFDENVTHIDFSEPEKNKYITPKGTILVRVEDNTTAQLFKNKFDLLFESLEKY
jgi:sugar-specific transcriptional regulator TrmB